MMTEDKSFKRGVIHGHETAIKKVIAVIKRRKMGYLLGLIEAIEMLKPSVVSCGIPSARSQKKGCNEVSKAGYTCTRVKGHKGEHHAHGLPGDCFERWS